MKPCAANAHWYYEKPLLISPPEYSRLPEREGRGAIRLYANDAGRDTTMDSLLLPSYAPAPPAGRAATGGIGNPAGPACSAGTP